MNIFSKPKTPAIPQSAPQPVPLQNDELTRERKRREAAASVQRSGRSSTILSDAAQSETLG